MDQTILGMVLGILADFLVPDEIDSWKFQNLPGLHEAVMATFYYYLVNYQPEIRSTTFWKLIWMYNFNIMCHMIW